MTLTRAIALTLLLTTPALFAQNQQHSLDSVSGSFIAERVVEGLSQPAAIEFLPDGRAIVLQRDVGVMSLVDFATGERTDVSNTPESMVDGDGGYHDVVLHPDYADNGWIYLSYSEGEPHYSTLVVDRLRIGDARLIERERIFTAKAYADERVHFGGRMQFLDGYLFITSGDRYHREQAQDLSKHTGSIVRLHDDGRVPADNPFVDAEEQRRPPLPEIWSYGHRNPQGLAVHPLTGELWDNEHGPRGGDELNLIVKGGNYGWPVASFGFEYDGGPIGKGIVFEEGMQQATWVYVPSIAPSDLVFYQGDAFPVWQGSWLIGSLAMVHLNRLVISDGVMVLEERLATGLLGRIRAIAVDVEGLVYLGNDSGEIWRLSPLE